MLSTSTPNPSKSGSPIPGFLTFVGLFVLWSLGARWYWGSHAEAAFKHFTGSSLPAGIKVADYTVESCSDNFKSFSVHYWLLTGSPAALRQLVESRHLREIPKSEAQWKPNLPALFGANAPNLEVSTGFEAGRPEACLLGSGDYLLFEFADGP